MPNVLANNSGNHDDLWLYKVDSDAADARNATAATAISNSGTVNPVYHAQGGSNTYVYRSGISWDFASGDTDGNDVTGNTVASATMTIRTLADITGFLSVQANTSNVIYCVNAIPGISYTTADFNSIGGWVSSGTYDGEVNVYGTANEAADSAITFDLNALAVQGINGSIASGRGFHIMLLSQDDFLSNIGTDGLGDPDVSVTGFLKAEGVRVHSMETSTSSYRPYLTLNYLPDVKDTEAEDIGKINGIAIGSISKVNGV